MKRVSCLICALCLLASGSIWAENTDGHSTARTPTELQPVSFAQWDRILEKQLGNIDGDPDITITGQFPGEKYYEELISQDELSRTIEDNRMYTILPSFSELRQSSLYKRH